MGKSLFKYLLILSSFKFLLASSFLSAESNHIGIEQITLAEESMWPPFTYQESGRPNKGLSLDLMNEIFSRLDLKYDLQLFPMNRIIWMAKNGEIDAISIISKNTERDEFLEFTIPHTVIEGLIVYSADLNKPIVWDDYKDLKPYIIGIVQGHNYGDEFNFARKEHELNVDDSATNLDINFQKLFHKRIDILLVNQLELASYLKNSTKLKLNYQTQVNPYNTSIYRMGFSHKSPAVQIIPMTWFNGFDQPS